jgi:protein O-GlcNAc transferase
LTDSALASTLAEIGAVLRAREWNDAEALCQTSLLEHPDSAAIHHALGLALCGAGAYERAQQALARACELDRSSPFARDLAIVQVRLRRFRDAVRVLEAGLPNLDWDAVALYLAAAVEAGDAEPALEALGRQRPSLPIDHGPFLFEYAHALHAAGRLREAEQALAACLAVSPEAGRAHDLLAAIYQDTGRGDLALDHWRIASRLRPGSGRARLRVAVACSYRGRLDESRVERIEALRLGLEGADYASALKLLLFDPREDAASIRDASRDAFLNVPPARSIGRRAPPARRLRIGYLSGEFHLTPAFYFLSPFLAAHDRSAFEITLYNSSRRLDARTADYRALGERWREVAHLSDDELVAVLDGDELDVIVDLSGHFPDNRLTALARRCAPVQATFPNYPATTGCPAVDYIFTDWWTSPTGTEHEYSERLHRVPSGYLVYAPPPAPAPEPSAAARLGRVTFGVIQQTSKLTDEAWDAYASILQRVPTARLLLHNGDAELARPDSATARFLRSRLSQRSVDPERLILIGPLSLSDHVQLLSSIDIALDTWPYTGQTTTAECLWMGVPVVSLRSRAHVGRVSAALLERVGLDTLVTETTAAYIEAACGLSEDGARLEDYRRSLRARCVARGLTDGATLARSMEAAYRAWAESPS